MARIADAYWRFEKRFSHPPTRSQRFSARHPTLIGVLVGVVMFAVWLLVYLGAGNGVIHSILFSLLGGASWARSLAAPASWKESASRSCSETPELHGVQGRLATLR